MSTERVMASAKGRVGGRCAAQVAGVVPRREPPPGNWLKRQTEIPKLGALRQHAACCCDHSELRRVPAWDQSANLAT